MKKQQLQSNKEAGIVSFTITDANERMLNAFIKYIQRIEYLINPDEKTNVDGVINTILDSSLSSRLREIAKKHGFTGVGELIEILTGCQDGEQVDRAVRDSEFVEMQKSYEEILSQIPLPENQKDLPL